MNATTHNNLSSKRAFTWLSGITALGLLIPLIAMQFTNEVNWNLADFVVMGGLIFGMGSAFILIARRLLPKQRIAAATICLGIFFLIWAELAVGVLGSVAS